jgi:hypothetical protein
LANGFRPLLSPQRSGQRISLSARRRQPKHSLKDGHSHDPTNDQYSNPVTKVAADLGSGGNGNTPSAPAGLHKKVVGGLPFTGLDVVALAAVAIALMSMGFALRRLTAERHAS